MCSQVFDSSDGLAAAKASERRVTQLAEKLGVEAVDPDVAAIAIRGTDGRWYDVLELMLAHATRMERYVV